ncbi:adenylate/guanylate cyclase domain-containing protein [Jeotgalibacillus proteolyticus]|uniref:adenylate/guanylate cyclase domain-containing protein n=1 Tax=Jeotgalibacillus proteolyticus TaxID=2082395 RepID=UPI003CF8F66C
MDLSELRDELKKDTEIIVSSEFNVEVRDTAFVPTLETEGITYPNLDEKSMKAKQIKTCVLFIDMRKSTDLNLKHKPETLTKLYGAFMRSMVKAAQHFGGEVRNIIGDRIMVVFNEKNSCRNALNTAALLNSVGMNVIYHYFEHNDIEFGIGVDFGRMLVSKGGIIKNGDKNAPYKSLVWLGKPANIASKLTDLANKYSESLHFSLENKLLLVSSNDHDQTTKTVSYKDLVSEEFEKGTDVQIIEDEDIGKWYLVYGEITKGYFPMINLSTNKGSYKKTPKILVTEKVLQELKDKNFEYYEKFEEIWKPQNSLLFPDHNIFGSNLEYALFKE